MARTDLETLVFKMEADISRLEKNLAKAASQTDRATAQITRRFDRMNKDLKRGADDFAASFRNALTGIAVGALAKEAVEYADAWTRSGNKIAAAGVALSDVGRKQAELADLARETRSNYESTVDLYAKLTRSSADLNASESQRMRVTETINKALVVAGASAAESASVITQLSQGLSSGVLQGDELRSLRENSTVIAKAIADEFNTTIGGLKALGAEGKLTSDRVFKAILNASKTVDDQFAKTTLTIGGAMENLKTSLNQYIGEGSAATGVSVTLAGAINSLANNFRDFADVIIFAGATFLFAGGSALVFKAGYALADLAVKTGVAGAAMVRFGLAMSFLGGPWGILIAGIAAALTYFALQTSESANQTARFNVVQQDNMNTLARAKRGVDALASSYRDLTEAQREELREANRALMRRTTATEQMAKQKRAAADLAKQLDATPVGSPERAKFIRENKEGLRAAYGGGGYRSSKELQAEAARLEEEVIRMKNEQGLLSDQILKAQEEQAKSKTSTSSTVTVGDGSDAQTLAARAESLELTRLQMQAEIEEANGRRDNADAIRDQIEWLQAYNALLADGMKDSDAAKAAWEYVDALKAQREAEEALAIRYSELDRQRELAALSGDERAVRAIERTQQQIDRVQELLNLYKGLSEADAGKIAAGEQDQADSAAARGKFKTLFSDSLIAALKGDAGNFWEAWLEEKSTAALRNALDNIADKLFDVFNDAMGGVLDQIIRGDEGGFGLGDIGGFITDFFTGGFGGGKGGGGSAKLHGRGFGGNVKAGQTINVGEYGKEQFTAGVDGSVLNNYMMNQMRQPMKVAGSGGLIYQDHTQYNFSGSGQELAEFRAMMEADKRGRKSEILATVAKARRDRVF